MLREDVPTDNEAHAHTGAPCFSIAFTTKRASESEGAECRSPSYTPDCWHCPVRTRRASLQVSEPSHK